MRAAYGGSVDIMSALIDHGANVNQQDVSLCRQLCMEDVSIWDVPRA